MKQLPTTTLKEIRGENLYKNISRGRKCKISYDESKHFVNITAAFSLKNLCGFFLFFFCISFTGTRSNTVDRLLYLLSSGAGQLPARDQDCEVAQSSAGTSQTFSVAWGTGGQGNSSGSPRNPRYHGWCALCWVGRETPLATPVIPGTMGDMPCVG